MELRYSIPTLQVWLNGYTNPFLFYAKNKEKYYVHNIFTILSQQILCDM